MQNRDILTLLFAGVAVSVLYAGPGAIAQAPAPALPPTATITLPSAGPADPTLRALPAPGGKKLHLLPATLETTQWGWFDNAQEPVLRVNSGDTIVLETMMHSHN